MRHPHARRRRAKEERRKARHFYELRQAKKNCEADTPRPDEAEAVSRWRGWDVVLAALGTVAAVGYIVAKIFS
jgi:hypothetical protein